MRAIVAAILFCISLSEARAGYNEGVAAYERGDYATALREFLPLAQSGDTLVQSYLGLFYQHGLGVKADLATAIDWYGRAADGGDALAQRILGDLHIEGVGGPPDYAAAALWYEAAASGGNAEAQRKLGELYLNGRGVPRNRKTAAYWLNKARQLGDPEARGDTPGSQVKRPSPRRKTSKVRVKRSTDKRRVRRTRKASLRTPVSCFSGRPDDPYHIIVKVELPESSIDHSRSIKELGRISGYEHKVLGLMKPDLRLVTRPKAQIKPQGKKYCFWVTGFDVSLRYHRMDVYVASEYQWGSCHYKAILAHEEEHVEVARRNLEKFAPLVEQALESTLVPTGRNADLFKSSQEARQYLLDLSSELLEPVYTSMIKALKKAQKIVDSPQSYARVRRRCSNW